MIALTVEPKQTEAQAGTTLGGYAWSDTIGWISLSGSGYGISVDASGNMSGYAWSDNIGWISAQPADVAGCPGGTCTPRISGSSFLGWLKAIAADGNGWDGWISLSCSNMGTCATSNYGITNSAGTYSGYAWGSEVVGWIDFSTALPPAASCTLLPASQTIVRGTNANLSWTSTNATTGTLSPGSVAMSPASAGSLAVQPVASATYTGTFTGAGGEGSCQATVNVTCAPIYSCSGQQIQYTDASCTTTNVGSACESPNYCTAGQSTCTVPSITFTTMGSSDGSLEARPLIVRVGETTRLYWNVSNATSCTVSGNGDSWDTTSSGAGGVESSPINSSAIYTLDCTALPGGDPLSLTATVTVVPAPVYNEE